MRKNSIIFVAALSMTIAHHAYADDQNNNEMQVQPDLTAAWIEPVNGQSPSWVQANESVALTQSDRQIVAANDAGTILKIGDQYVLTDAALHLIGIVQVPIGTSWLGMDDKNRIFAFDGQHLLYAESFEKALEADGFATAIKLEQVTQIDSRNAVIAYAIDQKLVFSNLDTAQTTQTLLRDFFDDERVAQMTPEAIENAKNKKNKSSKSKTKTNSSEEQSDLPPIEVQALVMRHDGVTVLKVHRLLQTRVFVSKDDGRSWTMMSDAPATIERKLGWIWNGKDRVLSADATAWLNVCGKPLDLFERYEPSQRPRKSIPVQLSNRWPDSPVKTVETVSEDTASEASTTVSEAEVDSQCIQVDAVPVFAKTSTVEVPAPTSYLSPRSLQPLGTRYYFTNEGTQVAPDAPQLWRHVANASAPERVELPQECDPLYVTGDKGLGVLLCSQGENASQIYAYVRSDDMGWYAEATLPKEIAQGTRMLMAEDGTLVLSSDCQNVVIPAVDAVFDAEGNVVVEAVPETTQVMCHAAVRDAVEIGDPEAWRIERINDALDFRPYGAGRVLALAKNNDQTERLIMLSGTNVETVVEAFDASPYQGVEMTPEGCFALYDAETSDLGSRLLTPAGKLSNVNCATAQELTLLRRQALSQDAEWEVGDNRFGMRLGAGAYFASGIQTWFMRVEGLFPIYGGKYELGAIFRMAGGNEGASMGYMGLLAARWRYDEFEKFDFAVGAGIGYGQLTGYVEKTEETAEGEVVETEKSAKYRKAHKATLHYMISGMAAYRLSEQWKIYINAELLGGAAWGIDIGAGIEIRF